MSSLQRLQSLKNRQERVESQIGQLEKMCNECNQQIKGESDFDQISKLNSKIDNYSEKVDELYDKLDNIEEQINQLKSSSPELSSNNHEDNSNNQKQLKIDESLCYIDFKKALDTFNKIQAQFNKDGDVALFFMEENLIKRGDLCLKRLENELKPRTSYRNHFRYCPITYTLGNLEAVSQGIATFFEVTKSELSMELLIKKIANSLQRNSVLFLEINCNIDRESDIDPLIPWFINGFWKPLSNRVKENTEVEENTEIKKYTGIKVVAVISSNLKVNERLLTESLSCYKNNDCSCFERDKLVKIPLENWAENEIREWLSEYSHPSLTEDFIEEKAYRLFQESSEGVPRIVCDALQQQWQTLIYPTTSD